MARVMEKQGLSPSWESGVRSVVKGTSIKGEWWLERDK